MKINDFGLFNVKGDEWRAMKSSISPALSLNKMKHMTPVIDEVTDFF